MSDTPEMIEARADSLVSDHEDLLRKLVTHRKNHHLSQEVVAERMGVSQPTVAKFERYDANPTLATIRRYALAVGARLETQVNDDCAAHRATRSAAAKRPPFFEFVAARHDEHRYEEAEKVNLFAVGWTR